MKEQTKEALKEWVKDKLQETLDGQVRKGMLTQDEARRMYEETVKTIGLTLSVETRIGRWIIRIAGWMESIRKRRRKA